MLKLYFMSLSLMFGILIGLIQLFPLIYLATIGLFISLLLHSSLLRKNFVYLAIISIYITLVIKLINKQ